MAIWTKEQQEAINARGCNLLVSAAAGSGKTAVLVERIIRLIVDDEIDIDRLLIVTFTHAAAGEMRERIGNAIIAEMEKKDEHEAHLRRQTNLLGRSSISTIHAFCTDVVRRNFHSIDVDPNFRVCDQIEADLLKKQAMDELLETEYENGTEPFLELVEMFGSSRDDSALANLVLKIFNFMQSHPYPMEWLKVRIGDFQVAGSDFHASPWYNALIEQINIELAGANALFNEALKWTAEPGGPVMYATALNRDIDLVDSLKCALEQGLTEFLTLVSGAQHISLSRAPAEIDASLKERVQTLRNAGKKIIKDIKQKFTCSLDEYLEDIHALYPCMQCLCQMEEEFTRRYHMLKMEKNLADFNDLEHYTLQVLADPEIAAQYQAQFAYIFVDEYQDSNLVQETILNFIRRDHNLFMVGDVKQSIYRFRLADPGLFMDKYRNFDESPGALDRRINLNSNFRSRKEILDSVNFIFSIVMSRDFGEMDYDENARLNPGLEAPAGGDEAVEVLLINHESDVSVNGEEESETSDVDKNLEDMSNIEAEAHVAAKRIKALMNEKIIACENQAYRNVDFRDIAVLMRTTKNWSGIFQEVLTAEGIPAFADVSGGYFEAPEVDLILNLLTLIDNRRQDIPLLSLMRSPIGGFGLPELIAIRVNNSEASFYEAIETYRANQDDELATKLSQFLEALEKWKTQSRFMHLDEFIWKLLMETGYYYYAGAMPGGQQRQANLRMLLDRASQYQQTSMQGLFNFIHFIERLKTGSSDVGTARLLGENENVVRIMSIHKSKGLEFPVVIMAGMGKKFNLSDSSATVLLHKDLGIGPRYIDTVKRTSADTIARIAMKHRIKMENLAEEMRVLYVGSTRPREKLIMIGTTNIERALEKWSRSISPFSLARAQNYLDWIGPALVRHPDGEILRQAAGLALVPEMIASDSAWKIVIVNSRHMVKELKRKQNAANDLCRYLAEFEPPGASPQKQLIETRLNWRYEHGDATRLPSKLSVTRIKNLKSADLDIIHRDEAHMVKKPRFCENEKTISAREKGTIMHFVIQHLDFAKTSSVTEIRSQIKEMVEQELLLPQAAEAVDISNLMQFCQSDLGKRVAASSKVCREVPFNLRCLAHRVFEGLDESNEELLIQGVIDLFFEENGELVLVDFKTDRVTPDNFKELLEQYRVQIDLYREALQKINQQKVKASYLYFFDTGQAEFL